MVSTDTISNAILKMYNMSKEERNELGQKCKRYVESEFSYQKTIDMWHDTLTKTIEDWEKGKSMTSRFDLLEI